MIAPVNESVWEHMKMAAFAVFIFSLVQYFFIAKEANNFFLTKAILILIIPILIAVLHLSYKAILGQHMVIIDISILFILIIAGQYFSYQLLTYKTHFNALNQIAFFVGLALLLMYVYFTFYPLDYDLFK